MPTKTSAPPIRTEGETIKEQEEAREERCFEETAALQPSAEAAVAGIVEAARQMYQATEDFMKVQLEAEELLTRHWGRRKRPNGVPSMDKVLELRKLADSLVMNPPPLPLPRAYVK